MKKRILNDVRIEVEPDADITRFSHIRWGDVEPMEADARAMDVWARDFEAFVRDHRSQDAVSLNVIREYEDTCEHCGAIWEDEWDSEGPCCCNAAVTEFDGGDFKTGER